MRIKNQFQRNKTPKLIKIRSNSKFDRIRAVAHVKEKRYTKQGLYQIIISDVSPLPNLSLYYP